MHPQGMASHQLKKQDSRLHKIHTYFREFCGNTSIHGLKFLGEKRSWPEKVWWIVVITMSLCICTFVILKTYTKWISSPVIVSFATAQTAIGEIPFPAITICTDVKARSSYIKFSEIDERLINGENLTEDELRKYTYMNLVCEKSATHHTNNQEINCTDALDFITGVAPTVNDIVESVKWGGILHDNPSNFFTPILTSEGVCYTFNLLDRTDIFTESVTPYKNFFHNGNISTWSIERGFFPTDSHRYPRFTVISGTAGGLDLTLTTFVDDIDYKCSPDFVGFKVSLQHPAQVPRGRKNFFTVPLNQIVLANIKPIILKTSDELRSYLPETRKCYFLADKKLKFYKLYNQHNCLFECLTNYTLENCGCVGFHMSRGNNTPVCGHGSRDCMETAKARYLLTDKASSKGSISYREKCNCLPSCTSLDFEVETSQSIWNSQGKHILTGNASSRRIHRSKLRIFFKDMQFITSVRNELYGMTDFLASCGGLLGLFMGFSAISLFEIIYFLTLRLLCNFKKQRNCKCYTEDKVKSKIGSDQFAEKYM